VILQLASASIGLKSSDPEQRLVAAKRSPRATIRKYASFSPPCSPSSRTAATRRPMSACVTLRRVRSTKSTVACACRTRRSLFTGLSLGSVLLLAALGLAITYGLMASSTWRTASS